MSAENPMIGKTIAEVIDRDSDYGGIDLIFTDGTVVRIEGGGYDDSTVMQLPLTPEDLEREAREAEERREAARLSTIRLEAQRAEEAEVKATRSPEEYVAWMDEHREGWRFARAMKQEFQGVIADTIRGYNRQVIGTPAVVPTSSTDTWGR